MFYALSDKLLLRGWHKFPWAVVNAETGDVTGIGKSEFSLLDLCNGRINLDIFPMPPESRRMLAAFVENGAVSVSDKPNPVRDDQVYFKYENRLIRKAHWSVTGRCNYNCRHCFLSAPDAKYGELPLKDILAVIDGFEQCGIYKVDITGGEPLVRRDFWDIIDALSEKNIKLETVYTNGSLLTEKVLDKFAVRGLSPEFNMSYDGPDGLHGWLRGSESADRDIERAFLLCKEKGFRTGAEMCIHMGNIHTIRKSVNILAGWGCRSLKITPVTSIGAWKENGYDRGFSFEKLYDTYLEYIPQYFSDDSPLSLMLGGLFACEKGTRKAFIPSIRYCPDPAVYCTCMHALNYMYISPGGRALPCMPFGGTDYQNSFPLILKEGMKACLSDSFYMEIIETPANVILEHNEKCRSCKYALKCLGGCRAAGLESNPDNCYSADESTCALFRGGYTEKLEAILQEYCS